MYVIMAYDVNEKRVVKVLKKARQYLTWVQNSLLEGEITTSKLEILKQEIKKIIDEEEDSVTWYVFESNRFFKKETYGVKKGEPNDYIF
ncbi:MAG: CRISPR-associated endonuclease Cas2 [Fervidobacterium sp.]|nr:CRISPR-associated endonuclease Cas2 [Fervidobacterium sp.]HRT01988.1 CRISPR-associated endonuclease Cas2 [Fervidobacterium sp.]HRV38365.1 CRISPR-associated endonuclease Cas2 [Fervidobacterium sp.]